MKDFIFDNLLVLIELALTLVVVIVSACKRKVKVTDSNLTSVLAKLPDFISTAEKIFGSGNGSQKISYVLSLCVAYYSALGGVCSEDTEGYFRDAVEHILSTPQKKEVL